MKEKLSFTNIISMGLLTVSDLDNPKLNREIRSWIYKQIGYYPKQTTLGFLYTKVNGCHIDIGIYDSEPDRILLDPSFHMLRIKDTKDSPLYLFSGTLAEFESFKLSEKK